MIDIQQTRKRLLDHLHALTVTIGERSVSVPMNLKKTAAYIASFYRELGLVAKQQAYSYAQMSVDNIIAEIFIQ